MRANLQLTRLNGRLVKYQKPLFGKGSKADVALIRLTSPVNGIVPRQINTASEVKTGDNGVIVGFGRSGGNSNDYGLKREGRVESEVCNKNYPKDELICWNFSAPVGGAGKDSNTCNADSGGPLFSASNGTLAGVTSGGENSTCLAGDHSYDSSIFQNRKWIQKTAWGLGSSPCGTLTSLTDGEIDRVLANRPDLEGTTISTNKPAFLQDRCTCRNGYASRSTKR